MSNLSPQKNTDKNSADAARPVAGRVRYRVAHHSSRRLTPRMPEAVSYPL